MASVLCSVSDPELLDQMRACRTVFPALAVGINHTSLSPPVYRGCEAPLRSPYFILPNLFIFISHFISLIHHGRDHIYLFSNTTLNLIPFLAQKRHAIKRMSKNMCEGNCRVINDLSVSYGSHFPDILLKPVTDSTYVFQSCNLWQRSKGPITIISRNSNILIACHFEYHLTISVPMTHYDFVSRVPKKLVYLVSSIEKNKYQSI